MSPGTLARRVIIVPYLIAQEGSRRAREHVVDTPSHWNMDNPRMCLSTAPRNWGQLHHTLTYLIIVDPRRPTVHLDERIPHDKV